jgi:hypothetical protein
MKKIFLLIAFGLVAMAGISPPAVASHRPLRVDRPYVIEKTCNPEFKQCHPRMKYAPGQHAGLAGAGSYWYQHAYGHYHGYSRSKHARWCASRYRTYDPGSDTFVGKGYTRYRCNSPYDGY